MIKWKREINGTYVSDCGRFQIWKSWDRIFGNHWKLYDNMEKNYYKAQYHERTLLDCKLNAEVLKEDAAVEKKSKEENV